MANSNLETLLIVFIAVTGLSVLMQACVLLGMFLTMRHAVKIGKEQAEEYRAKLTPVLEGSKKLMGTATELVATAKGLVDAVEPKIRSSASDLNDVTQSLRTQAERIQVAADEVTENFRRQASRVDGMTTSALNRVDRFGNFIADAVNVPVRQFSGVVAAAKAVVDTLRVPSQPRVRVPRGESAEDEKDLFV